jgi:hypothetical protein
MSELTTHRGLEPQDIEKLSEAYDVLSEVATRDCYCERGPEPYLCDACRARKARDQIEGVLDPEYQGLHPSRLTGLAEFIYVALWRKENKRLSYLNNGFGLLELILKPEGAKRVPHVSQRDADVATTVIQWLGTNCGRCFIDTAEKEIKRRDAIRQDFHIAGGACSPEAWRELQDQGEVYQVADQIAHSFISVDKNDSAMRQLRGAIITAIVEFRKRESKRLVGHMTAALDA